MPGEQFAYGFDNIGNRVSTASGGNSNGASLRSATYYANSNNQYTSRTVPNGLDVLGIANYQASVTVNGATQDYRRGEFYQKGLTITNSSGPVWLSVTNTASYSGSSSNVIGNLFIPKSPENYTYDADGNLTSDGRFTNIWDADNRLTNITSLSGDPTGSLVKLDFTYDYMGRRIQKIVSTNSGSGWTASYTNKFIYDGWNLVAVLDGGNHLLQSFTWGSDLSGSLQGAGGVGGLISTTVYGGANTGAYFPGYDGNGNVGALVSANNGLVDASYEYGPFGELLRATGPVAFSNPFRFSTKFQDDETGIIMYPRRPYSASTGRFLTRDPIDEDGGVNLYGLVANNPVNENDPLGLCNIKIRCNPVVEGFITVGWHCGVIGPDGQTYELGGVGVAGSSGGHPVIYPNPTYPDTPPDHYKDYPVSCNGCCGSVLACIQTFTAAAQLNPPTYYALWQNSNTYAHKMLNTCGCSVDPIPLCYTVLRSPRQGGPYTVCTTTTTPPHAVAW